MRDINHTKKKKLRDKLNLKSKGIRHLTTNFHIPPTWQ